LAAVETAAMYVFELLAVVAVVLPPRRLPALLLVGIAAAGVTTLGMIVSNVGTIYRFRYSFWILLIVAGVAGAEKLLARAWRRASIVAPACMALMLGSCTRIARADLAITNRTGTAVDALYLSPTDAPTWEENVLDGDVLRDGQTVEIRFRSAAKLPLWDLRAQASACRCRAEWKGLDTSRIARITLRGARGGTAVAEVDGR
jgi:hypothetical protein